MDKKEVKVFEDSKEINIFLCDYFYNVSHKAIEDKGFCSIALSGGNTPLDFYHSLSLESKFEWSKIHFFLVDERFVPASHPDNNFYQIKKKLFDKIEIDKKNIHFIDTDCSSIQESVKKYEDDIKSFFNTEENIFPKFDIILLGIGSDGHTASLFPETENLFETKNFVIASKSLVLNHERITFTLPLINKGKIVIFLVTGKEKKDILKRVLSSDKNLPASHVLPNEGSLLFAVDKKALE